MNLRLQSISAAMHAVPAGGRRHCNYHRLDTNLSARDVVQHAGSGLLMPYEVTYNAENNSSSYQFPLLLRSAFSSFLSLLWLSTMGYWGFQPSPIGLMIWIPMVFRRRLNALFALSCPKAISRMYPRTALVRMILRRPSIFFPNTFMWPWVQRWPPLYMPLSFRYRKLKSKPCIKSSGPRVVFFFFFVCHHHQRFLAELAFPVFDRAPNCATPEMPSQWSRDSGWN